MSMAMLPYLKKQHPGCRITCICGAIVAPLFRQSGLVDEIVQVDEKRLLVTAKVKSILSLWRRLFLRKFDLVLTAHRDPRYRLISLFVRAKERRYWGVLPTLGRYHARQYLELAGAVDPIIQFPEMNVSLKKEFAIEPPYIVVAPGGAKNVLVNDLLRRWPIENYGLVISELVRRSYKVLVIGSTSDEWIRPFLPVGYIDLIGKTDLLDLIAILERSELLITHDSGPLHLAKLAKCRVLALFGPTNPADFTSSDEGIEVIWGGAELACRPCFDGKRFACCSNNQCMKSISVRTVIDRALPEKSASKIHQYK